MSIGIHIQRSEEDPDHTLVTIADGDLTFTFQVFLESDALLDIAALVEQFDSTSAMSSAEFTLGSFGPATAGGALGVNLLSRGIRKVHLSLHAQGEFYAFGDERAAKEMRLHLVTEPAQLDRFASELRAMASTETNSATLAAQDPFS